MQYICSMCLTKKCTTTTDGPVASVNSTNNMYDSSPEIQPLVTQRNYLYR